jgi:arabinose-5-phosphate isomerase
MATPPTPTHTPAPTPAAPASTPGHPAQPAGAGASSAGASSVGADQAARAAQAALARRVVEAEALAVRGLAARIDDEFHAAVDLICGASRVGGSVLVTGLGKSGLIGAKISATLASLGIASHFVHPTEAAHGDLGNFRASDVCVALSYSGETDEVIALCSVLMQDGVPVVSMSAEGRACGLGRVSRAALSIGQVERDADLSPAPMASTTAMLALGDALALCAADALRVTHADFAKRHPGGSLGGRLRPISEALRFVVGVNLHPVRLGVSVGEALRTSEVDGRRPGALLVVDEHGKLAGLFTDGDLRRLVLRDPGLLARPIDEVMTRGPATLPSTARVADAEHLVRASRRDEVPIVDEQGRPVGLLDVQDLVAMRLVK